MNLNLFFGAILSLLVVMFLLLRPVKIDIVEHKEIPQLEFSDFIVYNIKQSGVQTILQGKSARRYENRYEISKLRLEDSSKGLRNTILADEGLYREDMIYLSRKVYFSQEDRFNFTSSEAQYDMNNSIVTTQGAFVITAKEDTIRGERLRFLLKRNRLDAKNVVAEYETERE